MTILPPSGPGDDQPVVEVNDDATIDTRNTRLGDGVNRCPRCGATEIQLRPAVGMLRCQFCRYEWSEARLNEKDRDDDIGELRGKTVGTGASTIDADTDAITTLKCAGCGSEVVVNTAEQMGALCHWCRHVLTINEQVPNGAVPDAVLPFRITHDEAMTRIREFAGRRRFFANRGFVREFQPENVLGVYMPYLVVDGNVSAEINGVGEVKTRQYTRKQGDQEVVVYDADVYQVGRQIAFTVDDLTIESSAQRGNMNASMNTNNVINTILPFDTENAVKWNASYLTGFTSEKRDLDVEHLKPVLHDQLLSIARSRVVSSVNRYDRGVRWERERLDVHGTRWIAMYLPVWLYSYYHESGGRGLVHYIAVNGRTGETMGSVPISQPRLVTASLGVFGATEVAIIAMLAGG